MSDDTTSDRFEGLTLDEDEQAEAKRLGLSPSILLAHKYVAARRQAAGTGFDTVHEYRVWLETNLKARAERAAAPLTDLELESAEATRTSPARYKALKAVRNLNDWLAIKKP